MPFSGSVSLSYCVSSIDFSWLLQGRAEAIEGPQNVQKHCKA